MYPVRNIFVASVRIRCCQSHNRPLVPALAHLWATPARIPFPLLTKVSSLALLDFSSLLAKSVGICYSSFSFRGAIISLLFTIHIYIVFFIGVTIHPFFHLVNKFFHIFLYGKSFQSNLCVIYSYLSGGFIR